MSGDGRASSLVASATAPERLGAARIGLAGVFFINGALFGNWASRIPTIKEQVNAGPGALGLALLGIAVGALISKQVAGQMVVRLGSAPVTRLGILLSCLGLVLPALAVDTLSLGLALVGFGMAMGIVDVAMNSHGITIEERSGRPTLSFLHAMYSIGGLSGALAGGRLAAADLDPVVHYAIVAAVLGLAALAVCARLLPSSVDAVRRTVTRNRWVKLPRDHRLSLYLLALAGLCGMAGEGAAADWSAVYLHDDLDQSTGFASLGYAAYSVAMAAGRLIGNRAIERWGGLRVVMWSVMPGAAVFALALTVGNQFLALCGFACLGIGLAVVIPVIFSMAGRLGGEQAGPAITLVSSISGTGFLAGPPLIGFLAEYLGLPTALGTVSLLAIVSAVLMYVITARQGAHAVDGPSTRTAS
jgi:MFS family permease